MIIQFVEAFESRRDAIRARLSEKHPENYAEIVKAVVSEIGNALRAKDQHATAPDPERVHKIDDGRCQGTLVFVIAETGYQPSSYWYVRVGYGSCSGCDTLEHIRGYTDEAPTEQQVSDYMTLALHIVQGLSAMGDEADVAY